MREVSIELDEKDWEERRNINKRKKLILEGKDPDQVRKEAELRRKKEWKREKKARLQAAAQSSGKLSKKAKKVGGLLEAEQEATKL